MGKWRDSIAKPVGYPFVDWPMAVYLDKAEQRIAELESLLAETQRLYREKVAYTDSVLHDRAKLEARNKQLMTFISTLSLPMNEWERLRDMTDMSVEKWEIFKGSLESK